MIAVRLSVMNSTPATLSVIVITFVDRVVLSKPDASPFAVLVNEDNPGIF